MQSELPGRSTLGGGGLVAKSYPPLVTPWTVACQAPLCPWDSPGNNTEVVCHLLLTLSNSNYLSNIRRGLLRAGRVNLYQDKFISSPSGHHDDFLQ